MTRRLSAVAVVWLLGVTPLGAHRLDEYLQAARMSIGRDVIQLELDLTPGVEISSRVLRSIDADEDGDLSEPERRRYVDDVVSALGFELDGRTSPLTLDEVVFPPADALRDGTGAIRLNAHTGAGRLAAGRHEVRFTNRHAPEISVYLVNALVPPAGISITGQRRDFAQREFIVTFTSDAPASQRRPWTSLAIGMAAVGMLVVARLRRDRRR
jgi:hypothetical protein